MKNYEKVDLGTLYPISLSSKLVENLLNKHCASEVSRLTKKEIVSEVFFFGNLYADGTIKLNLHTATDLGFIQTSGLVLTHTIQDEAVAKRVLEKEMLLKAVEAYQQEQDEIQQVRIKQIYLQMFDVPQSIAV